jgi:hypothetical protein
MPLAQIIGSTFNGGSFAAGAMFKDGKVARAAPIIGYMHGWTEREVRDKCQARGWSFRYVVASRPDEGKKKS